MGQIPDPAAHWKTAVELARTWRGAVLERTLLVERAVDNILAHVFCSDEGSRDSFKELVLLSGAINLSSKGRILRDVLRRRHPDLVEEFKATLASIDGIRESRNQLAHAQIELPKEPADPEVVRFTRIKNGERTSLVVSRTECQAILDRCTEAARRLIVLQEEVVDRVTGLGRNPHGRAFLDEMFRVLSDPQFDHYLYKAVEIPGSLRRTRLLTARLHDEERERRNPAP